MAVSSTKIADFLHYGFDLQNYQDCLYWVSTKKIELYLSAYDLDEAVIRFVSISLWLKSFSIKFSVFLHRHIAF